jgi:hypothetical protein
MIGWKRYHPGDLLCERCQLELHETGVIGKEMRHYHTAQSLARRYHPAWLKLTPAMKQLITRNSYQVMGPDLQSPCLFVLCWTPSGLGQGGTGQSIRIAKAHDIPVFDMAKPKP